MSPFFIQHPRIDAKVTENGRFQLVDVNVKLDTLCIKTENNVSVSWFFLPSISSKYHHLANQL